MLTSGGRCKESDCFFDAEAAAKFQETCHLHSQEVGGLGALSESPKNQRESLEAILKGTIADLDLPDILLELTEILCRLHKEVIVLIDEYGAPLTSAANHYLSDVCLSPVRQCALLISFAGK